MIHTYLKLFGSNLRKTQKKGGKKCIQNDKHGDTFLLLVPFFSHRMTLVSILTLLFWKLRIEHVGK